MAGTAEIDPQLVISYKFPESTYSYTERDAALYALGVGACSRDPVDDKELKYVYHQDGQQSIEVLPTFASLFSAGLQSHIIEMPGLVFDPRLLLHGQQYIEIYKPLPSNGCILNKATVSGLHDKGLLQILTVPSMGDFFSYWDLRSGKSTVLEVEILSYEKESGVQLCMQRSAVYLRGAGGFSQSPQPYSYTKYPSGQISTYKIPKSQPFVVFEECTHPSQALLYRLSGDYNPLHSDPRVAEIAGFSRPILHGLCTLGFAIRAIINSICRGDQNMIRNITGRFLLHVYPGEKLITEMWIEGLSVIYQVKVKERNKAALSGIVTLNRFASSL